MGGRVQIDGIPRMQDDETAPNDNNPGDAGQFATVQIFERPMSFRLKYARYITDLTR